MSDLKGLLDREARSVSGGPDALERMTRRAHRRQVRRRVATGTLALVIAAVGSLAAFVGLGPGGDGEGIPVGPQDRVMTAEIGGVTIDYPSDWTLLDVRTDSLLLPDPMPVPVLELLNVRGESCLGSRGSRLTERTVVLQVIELVGNSPSSARWPVEMSSADDDLICGRGRKIAFSQRSASWTASGRAFSATLLVGPSAAQADIDRAFTAFRSLRFGPRVTFGDGRGPQQVVGSGPGWVATAFEEPTGDLCLHVMEGDREAGRCGLGVTGRLDYWVQEIDGGRVVLGTAERGTRSIAANGMPAHIVRPLDRYGVDFDLFAVEVPGGTPITIEVQAADGSRYGVAEAVPAPSPPVPAQTDLPPPPLEPGIASLLDAFMDARFEGRGAEDFLSPKALQRYERGDGSLSLYDYMPEDGNYKIPGWDPAGDGIRVVIRMEKPAPGWVHESLWIEENPETGKLLIVNAERNE